MTTTFWPLSTLRQAKLESFTIVSQVLGEASGSARAEHLGYDCEGLYSQLQG